MGISPALDPVLLLSLLVILLPPRIESDFQRRNGILLPSDYNKVVAPSASKNFVTIGFEVHDIPQVDDMRYTVTLSMSIYCKWNDSR